MDVWLTFLITDILEDAGIAWPNPGMFFQASQQIWSPLSPFRKQEADPESHAHSPRTHHATEQGHTGAAGVANPQGLLTDYDLMPPPPFRIHRQQGGDPFLPQYGHIQQDPFIDQQALQGHLAKFARKQSSSGDISMPDRPPRSHPTSSEQDQSMPDMSRPLSPVSSFYSYSMPDYSRPMSPASHRVRSDGVPPSSRHSTPRSSRQVSVELLGGLQPGQLVDGGQDTDAPTVARDYDVTEYDNSFNDILNVPSPRRVNSSGIYAPANTRVSSATNTPPAVTRPSAAAEARALSYTGKSRTVSSKSRDPSVSIHTRQSSETLAKPISTPQMDIAQRPCKEEGPDTKGHEVIKERPAGKIKSRKEGRSSDADASVSEKGGRKFFIGHPELPGKENEGVDEISTMLSGDQKRRRVSEQLLTTTDLDPELLVLESPKKRVLKVESKANSRETSKDGSGESLVARQALAELENAV